LYLRDVVLAVVVDHPLWRLLRVEAAVVGLIQRFRSIVSLAEFTRLLFQTRQPQTQMGATQR
jgi:hypothetical protein